MNPRMRSAWRLSRCFSGNWTGSWPLERRFEEFAALRKPCLKAIFDVHAAGGDAQMTFGKNFMKRCFPKLSQQQKNVLPRQLDRLVAVLERRFEEFAARKPCLKAIFDVHAAGGDTQMTFGKNFMNRRFPKLSQQQKDVLLGWEAMLCEPADAERLAAQPVLQRQLDRLVAVLERRFEEFAALRKPCLTAIFDVHAAGGDTQMTFGKNFMNRCFPKLSQQQKDVLLEWEAMLCEPADAEPLAAQPVLQRQLDRLVAVLERRFEEFAALRKPCLKAIFDVKAISK